MTKILMVCLGNICRSPLAEGILKSKVDPNKTFVDSAGTTGYHVGNRPDVRSIAVAKKNGIDIGQQRCRKFTKSDFEKFDRIYTMDKSNFDNVIRLAGTKEDKDKVQLLLNDVDSTLKEVPDPYYGGEEGFDHVFDLINTACERIANSL